MDKEDKKLLNTTVETLQDLLILELLREEVPPHEVRKVLGVAMARVSRISKLIKK